MLMLILNKGGRASARDMYRANLDSNRASKRWQQEKNSVAARASKRRDVMN